ncbi:alpha amylase catalytic region [Haloterrigena turkmenica DSM 5511]|uniref:Alpha amylase catalytic region n=1 Tax=Haloterrigena turkmenica (strain ATCC 51198 / DSM 5511 / JCM 9101 / NCIMB 13204 / VKM B-1734 / 4k) TaxID=543526 RepID=D2RWM7_HALTV|nr:alpha-amylase family glycosyl hydrolase [Haloterrigena turkmenica]ADB61528.1 alpha amylase catalytic region [Haloterrigena turkmenica DSM 5511]
MDQRRLCTDGGEPGSDRALESDDGSHHPGSPRFVAVDEGIVDPNGNEMETRDDLAPRNPDGDATYAWRVLESPEGSNAIPTDGPIAEFEPDVPGEYTLALEASDGPHELTVRVFPEADEDAPRPQVELDATVEGDRVRLSATASVVSDGDSSVEYYVDDRNGDVLESDGTIPIGAIDEPVRVYAVAVDERHSVPDAIELVPADDAADEPSVRVERPFESPEWAVDAVVYEVFTRRFPDRDEPTFETIAERLDHLETLGIDVLWLTPFLDAKSGFGTPMENGGPHGYNTTNYFGVDPDLGTMAGLEALVDACHERDIRVVFDLVINHTADTHPFYEAAVDETHPDHERYRDWYRWADFDERAPDTYFGWDDIPNLNYANPEVREYLLSVVDFWTERVDGFRADVAWGVPLSFWTEVSDRVSGADSDFFLLDETLPSDVEMGGGRFHTHHDDVLHDTLEALGASVAGEADNETAAEADEAEAEEDAVADEFTDSAAGIDTTSADAILEAVEDRQRRGAHPDSEWLLYVENHDTDRYLDEYGRDAQRAAGAATFTLPGSPMLYYGQETGVTGRRDPMNWGAFDEDLLEYYRRLIDLRNSHPALRSAADLECIEYETDTDAAVAFARADPASGRRVVVAFHFGAGTARVELGESVTDAEPLLGADALESGGTLAVDSVVVLEGDES